LFPHYQQSPQAKAIQESEYATVKDEFSPALTNQYQDHYEGAGDSVPPLPGQVENDGC
jgi:hypothetical protein